MAPLAIRNCRRNRVQATDLSGHGICITSALEWAYYKQSMKMCSSLDPKISIPLQQVKAWMRQFQESDEEHKQEIKRQWPSTLMRMKDARTRWMRAKGPMAAAICTLLDMGWRLPQHTTRLPPCDEEHANETMDFAEPRARF